MSASKNRNKSTPVRLCAKKGCIGVGKERDFVLSVSRIDRNSDSEPHSHSLAAAGNLEILEIHAGSRFCALPLSQKKS
jgi:hypothetical protein